MLFCQFNALNTNLSNQVLAIISVAGAIEQGDFSRRIEVQAEGMMLALGKKVNGVASILSILKPRITEMCLLVGNDGHLGQQVEPGIALQGEWSDLCSHFNVRLTPTCPFLSIDIRSRASYPI